MKKTFLLLLSTLVLTSCYKEDAGGSPKSHKCGYYIQKSGTYCERVVSGTAGYCWQHQ